MTTYSKACFFGVIYLVFLSGCASNAPCENKRNFIDDEVGISITPPSDYIASEVWSPDSSLVKFTKTDDSVVIFLELGIVGYPDYTHQQDYEQNVHLIDRAMCELITYTNDFDKARSKSLKLRCSDRRYARAWATATPDRVEEARQILLTFRWWK